MFSSSNATQGATGNSSNAVLDKVLFSFSDDDDYFLSITADLAEGQRAFSFGCDTMLGTGTTSSYADNAALEAQTNPDHTLKLVAMIGAASQELADPSDPAFVISPITPSPLFWLGYWSSRQPFAFNESYDGDSYIPGPVKATGSDVRTAVTKVHRTDSGMTMSWLNLPSGGQVTFVFSVGDVESTGAVSAGVNYDDERIEGLEPNEEYEITILDARTGNPVTPEEVYTILARPVPGSANGGYISLEGTDTDGGHYDLTGKMISIAKKNSVDTPYEEVIGARPDSVGIETTDPNGDTAERPIDIRLSEAKILSRSITVVIDLRDPDADKKMAQQYRIVDEDGNPLGGTVSNWKTLTDGKVTFEGLEPDTTYLIQARIPANSGAPGSIPVSSEVKTAKDVEVTMPGTAQLRGISGEQMTAPPIVVTGGSDAKVTYSTGLAEAYGDELPAFKKGGTYTVYYRIEQTDSEAIYGSYTLTIDPMVTIEAGEATVTLGDDTATVTKVDENNVIVKLGGNLYGYTVTLDTPEGKTFGGWYTDSAFANLFSSVMNFAGSAAIVRDTTLYARWVQNLSNLNIDQSALDGATGIQLKKGGITFPQSGMVNPEGGAFNISGVPDDEYELVLQKRTGGGAHQLQTITTKVKVVNGEMIFADGEPTFPSEAISSKVTVESGAPAVIVSGLEKEAAATKENGELKHWEWDGGESNKYAVLELKFSSRENLTAISEEAAAANLRTGEEQELHKAQTAIGVASGNGAELDFFDASVIRTDYWNDTESEVYNISELSHPLEIAIPYEVTEGEAVTVYRYHVEPGTGEGEMQEFRALSRRPAGADEFEDQTFFVGDNVVYVYTSKFSVYGIKKLLARKSRRSRSVYEPLMEEAGQQVAQAEQQVAQVENDYPSVKFSDVKAGAWYHDAIRWALEQGYMNGVGNGVFKPNGITTRAQVAAVLYRMAGSPAVENSGKTYSDTPEGQWYSDAIAWADANGVVTGFTDGTFRPDNSVTREQFAAMVYRYAKTKGQGFEGAWAFPLRFTDAKNISDYAHEALCWMTMNGVMLGVGDNLEAKNNATRAQIATMFQRYAQLDQAAK